MELEGIVGNEHWDVTTYLNQKHFQIDMMMALCSVHFSATKQNIKLVFDQQSKIPAALTIDKPKNGAICNWNMNMKPKLARRAEQCFVLSMIAHGLGEPDEWNSNVSKCINAQNFCELSWDSCTVQHM